MTRSAAAAAGQVPNTRDAFLTAFGHDVRGTEVPSQVGAGGVTIGTICSAPSRLRGQHRRQSDGCRRRSPDGVAGDACGDRAVMAGAQHIGKGQQGGQQLGVLADGQLDQRPVAWGTRTASPCPPSTPPQP